MPAAADRPDLQVERDGEVVGRPEWGTPIPVDPGAHVVEGPPACVPAGTLIPGGTPSVGFAADPQGSAGFEVQVDNVAVDVHPPHAGSGSACEPGMAGDAGRDGAPDRRPPGAGDAAAGD